MTGPAISVVLPTFNRVSLVTRAIDSVQRQEFTPKEIIVVDDGSTDGTQKKLADCAPEVRYIYQENRGVSAARNAGIAASTGDWVAFLDSDDVWTPSCLKRHAEAIGEHGAIVASVVNCVFESADGQNEDWFTKDGIHSILQNQPEVVVDRPFVLVVDHLIGVLDACVFRRDVLLSTRLFDESIDNAEDWDVVAQMSLKGPFRFAPFIGVRAIRRPDDPDSLHSMWSSNPIASRLCWQRVFRRLLAETRLTDDEERSLRRQYASNQRAVGNLFLQSGAIAAARSAYREALVTDKSVASLGRLALSYSPFYVGRDGTLSRVPKY